jgi:glucose-fructose oxidoreductase
MTTANRRSAIGANGKVRYAVVGLGYISQVALLPGFGHAEENSELTALVSGDAEKLKQLGKQYGVRHTFSYEQYEECLNSGEVDAVYIGLPNSMHRDFSVRAARAGVHVLCEKPMAITEEDCEAMIAEAKDHEVKLMIAYRLHFEEANLKAIELVQSGKLGDVRIFNSTFTQEVKAGDIRLRTATGGGTLYDIGIYCINAARYLFRAEPIEALAVTAKSGDERFREVEEMASAVLRFPGDRLAAFTCSFGTAQVSAYRVVGSKGDLRLDPAYEFVGELKHYLTIDDKTKETTFASRDQFAPQLLYFSNCVLKGEEPEPSGQEGLADVRVIRALYQSAQSGRPVRLAPFERQRRPTPDQEIHRPPVKKPKMVHASSPSGGSRTHPRGCVFR